MAKQAEFTTTPLVGTAALSTANTARDGSGTLATVITAPATGARVDRVTIKATGTTTAGMVRLFHHNGSAAFLIAEIPVPAITPGANAPAFEQVIDFNTGETSQFGLVMPNGHSLRASTHNAESFHIVAFGGSF